MINKNRELTTLFTAIDKLQNTITVETNNRIVNLNNSLHRFELRCILKEDYNWDNGIIDKLFERLLGEKEKVSLVPGPPTAKGTPRYYWRTPKGTISLSTTGNAQKKGYTPATKDQAKKADKGDKKKKDDKKVDKKSPTEAPTEDGVDRSGFDKKDPKDKDAPNGPTQQEILEDLNKGSLDVLTEYQEEVQRNREKGIAGMGGPVASEGESKYCDANNTDLGKWAGENKEAIINKRKELAGKKRNAEEIRTAKALGLDPNSDEFLNYLATRETWVEQQREEAKKDPNHVFHKKGKKGF